MSKSFSKIWKRITTITNYFSSAFQGKDEVTFLKFLDHFLVIEKCSKEERVLLIVDNHETNLSLEALDKASAYGIVVVTFPLHTSYKLQPLKNHYDQDTWLYNHKGNTFDYTPLHEHLR